MNEKQQKGWEAFVQKNAASFNGMPNYDMVMQLLKASFIAGFEASENSDTVGSDTQNESENGNN